MKTEERRGPQKKQDPPGRKMADKRDEIRRKHIAEKKQKGEKKEG